MPTYEYKCNKCGYIFEEFQSISSEPLKKCRKEGCDGDVERLFSPGAGFLFKGSGFYITDYRSDSYKKAASADKSSPSSSSGSSSSKDSSGSSGGSSKSSSSSSSGTSSK
ncbi:MAG TPA: FmdB family zinc ribbon protein [Chitinispirillaceae bacterium]|nr:FmdB family zinc ribbon protein [Chitinispirillaceae bacterium]